MCGIFGSDKRDEFAHLAELNSSRGDYSSGFIAIHTKGITYHRQEGIFNKRVVPKNATYYLGHVRAPTSFVGDYDIEKTHPFSGSEGMYWAHNGILNTKDFEKAYGENLDVDSKWIGKVYRGTSFEETIEQLNGTYGIWIYDPKYSALFGDIFLVRKDCTIFLDKKGDSFSSARDDEHHILIPNNVVYAYDYIRNEFHKSFTIAKTNPGKFFIPYEH